VIETFSFRPIFFVGAPVREMAEGSEEWRQKIFWPLLFIDHSSRIALLTTQKMNEMDNCLNGKKDVSVSSPKFQ
jgi:hypothetical protein